MLESMSIKEIKEKIDQIEIKEEPFLQYVKNDPRKGVQKLYVSWLKKDEKREELRKNFYQMSDNEEKLWDLGYVRIGGIDEVGRGPLAGPVVASCVILSPQFYLPGLTDSKKLSKQKRAEFFQYIQENALAIGVGVATAKEIDALNIYEATKLAMQRSIEDIELVPDYLLLDAMTLNNSMPQQSIIKGDTVSISIAASSVIAKEIRDEYMVKLGEEYPQYGFQNHMGYGTKEHLQALEQYGAMEEHRRSFSPVRNTLTLI